MNIIPQEHPYGDVYKLLTAAVVPRPIAWVSTVNLDGQPNLAPYSFFNGVCSNPPTVLFCPGIQRVTRTGKDTYHNVKATGEFVVNFVTDDLAEAMNVTAVEVPPEVNEFEQARLTAAPGTTVNVPHVAETPIYFECKLHEIVTISEEPGGGYIVIGTVTYMHFDDAIVQADNRIDFDAYKPVGRMTGPGYVHTTDRFNLERPPSEIR